jgi:hypothetical protein
MVGMGTTHRTDRYGGVPPLPEPQPSTNDFDLDNFF